MVADMNKRILIALITIVLTFMFCVAADFIMFPPPFINAKIFIGCVLLLIRQSLFLSAITFGVGALLFRQRTEKHLVYTGMFAGLLAGVIDFWWQTNNMIWLIPLGNVWSFLYSFILFTGGAAIWTLGALKLRNKPKYLKFITIYIPIASLIYAIYTGTIYINMTL